MATQFVSPEFRGLARSFRQGVEIAERTYDQAMIAKVIKPLRVRLARKPMLRSEAVIDITRALESMANPFRISSNIEVVKRKHLRITEMVVGTAKDREDHWQDGNWDPTVSILRIVLTTEGGVDVKTAPIVTISGHAIARWFERSRSRNESALVSDLAMILQATEPDHALASHGVWAGPTINAHTKMGSEVKLLKIRTIRTYLHNDQIADQRRFKRSLVAA